MPNFSKEFFSESTNGRGILVTATATPGTLIHTAVSGTDDMDEVYLYAVNESTSTKLLTIEFGGVTAPDDNIEVKLAGEEGLALIVPGVPINNALEVRAFQQTGSTITIFGWVNRITA